jgi:hypothetical protein
MSSVRLAPGSCSERHCLSCRLMDWEKAGMLDVAIETGMGVWEYNMEIG